VQVCLVKVTLTEKPMLNIIVDCRSMDNDDEFSEEYTIRVKNKCLEFSPVTLTLKEKFDLNT